MASEFYACLLIVHAVHALENTDEQYSRLAKEAEHDIDRLQSSLGTKGKVIVVAGKPVQSVCHHVQELSADLVVIGRSSQPGIFGRLRANAYGMIRQSPCPVVSI